MGGGYSQIRAELILIKKAISIEKYQHLHLLSGSDLPIKTQDEIISFFEKWEGTEFVRFEKERFSYPERVRFYYPFQERQGRSNKYYWRLINGIFLGIQRMIGVNRNGEIQFQKGTNWFSITDSLARYIVEKEDWIHSVFRNTRCCDEVFLQTIIVNSIYKQNLFHAKFENEQSAIMRYIDWTRGFPYVFRDRDLNELKASEMMFARKFDAEIDSKIIVDVLEEFGHE